MKFLKKPTLAWRPNLALNLKWRLTIGFGLAMGAALASIGIAVATLLFL